MDDDNEPASGGDAKTAEQLRIARADAKAAREDAQRYRGELTTVRAELTKTRNELEGQIETLKTSHASELEKTKLDLGAKATAAEKAAEEAKTSAQQRVMMAELRSTAKDHSPHDVDAVLKLMDMSEAKLDDDGNLTNAAELLESMKAAKPYLFGVNKPGTATGTTSSTASTPRAAPPATFNARTASPEEFKARMAEINGIQRANPTQYSVRVSNT